MEKIMRKNNCGLLFYLVYRCKLVKRNDDNGKEDIEIVNVSFFSENRRILDIIEYDKIYQEAITHINETMGVYVKDKSEKIKTTIS